MEKRPKAVCLDLDDTVLDFIGQLCIVHNQKHKTFVTRSEVVGYPLKGDEVENIYGTLVEGENLEKTFKELEPHGLYAVLPVFQEAKQALELIREMGYKIIFMTARPPQFREQTELSLIVNHIKYDMLLFEIDKATAINKLNEQYEVVLFADDKASTVRAVNNKCQVKYPILINRAHNERYKSLSQKIIRANDLLETIKLLRKEI
jgi:uncharacterized HAD superfamily protein